MQSTFETSLSQYANEFIDKVANKVYAAVSSGDISSLSQGSNGQFSIILDELQ
jgi:hypothetical protein